MGGCLAEILPHQADRVGKPKVLQYDGDVCGGIEVRTEIGFDLTLQVDQGGSELHTVAVEKRRVVVEIESLRRVLGGHDEFKGLSLLAGFVETNGEFRSGPAIRGVDAQGGLKTSLSGGALVGMYVENAEPVVEIRIARKAS